MSTPGWDAILDALAFGSKPIALPVLPGLEIPATGDGRRDQMPYVNGRCNEVSPRMLTLYNKPDPLTREEWAELCALETNWRDGL